MRPQTIYFLFLLLPFSLTAQDSSYRTLWRFTFEDDLFKPFLRHEGSIDRYYTTGLKLEHYSSNPTRQWIEKLMPSGSGNSNKAVSYAIGSNMYTPSHLSLQKVDSSDRPYAGWLYASARGTFSKIGLHSRRITIDYSAGILGPPSLQKQLQIGFHKLIGPLIPSTIPEGWNNQISTALAINANMQYEHSWLHSPDLADRINQQNSVLECFPIVELNAGTVMNYIRIGSMLSFQTSGGSSYFMSGPLFNTINPNFIPTPHSTSEMTLRKRKTYLIFYVKPSVFFLAYNSMLSGGILSFYRSSYVLSNSLVRHVIGQADAGVMVQFSKFGFLYTCSYRTKEFAGALPSFWAGVSVLLFIKDHNTSN